MRTHKDRNRLRRLGRRLRNGDSDAGRELSAWGRSKRRGSDEVLLGVVAVALGALFARALAVDEDVPNPGAPGGSER
jgi:hypothetical protein